MKYVTFQEPVLGLLSPDFIYISMNRIETNYPVGTFVRGCRSATSWCQHPCYISATIACKKLIFGRDLGLGL